MTHRPRTGTPARYFHGTTVALNPGDLLVPGNHLGKGVSGTGDRSAHVYATSAPAGTNAETYAIAEAEEWGSDAADSFCDGTVCGLVFTATDFQPHHDAYRDGEVLPCVYVYEIAPRNPATVEPDDSTDVVHGGVRMESAQVLRRIQ